MEPNFSGYVTKAGLKCTDGRVIKSGAFKHQDGLKVPLVYQHNHDDINQVLGHVILSEKDDGVWGDAYLNDSVAGKNAGHMVQHGDLDKFSIWAKNLVERGFDVEHGDIQEVSLVLAGANSGATVQNILAHSGLDEDDNMMVVGFELKHTATATEPVTPNPDAPQEDPKPNEPAPDAPKEDATVGDVLATLTDEQRKAVDSVIDDIVTEALTEALTEEPDIQHDNLDSSKKGSPMSRNVFDQSKNGNVVADKPQLKHDDVRALFDKARGKTASGDFVDGGGVNSLREFTRGQQGQELMHADTYGVQNLEILFPDAQALMNTPTWVDRRQDWVKKFLGGTSHSPFSRIKTMYADITADEARARGYIKAHEKVEEVFPVFKRTTGPALIYKKQKLDRMDIIDITDFDVVAWMKAEMRGKLDEEIARAGLFGDLRPVMVNGEMNPDKIPDPAGANSGDGIRAIVNDADLYVTHFDVPLPDDPTGDVWNVLLDTVTEAGEFYMGSGNKTAFVSYRVATKLLTIRDNFGHRIYRNLGEVAGDMDVNEIVRVPTELMPDGVLAIVLDLSDYNFGTNRGGEVTLFDDFDIDFNQYKYLIETYLSGALTLPYSAQIFHTVAQTATKIAPTEPTRSGNVVTVPTQTGVTYRKVNADGTYTSVSNGATITLTENAPVVELEAVPAAGYYFETGDSDRYDTFTFEYEG